jgi:hypothetical protein
MNTKAKKTLVRWKNKLIKIRIFLRRLIELVKHTIALGSMVISALILILGFVIEKLPNKEKRWVFVFLASKMLSQI